MKTERLVLMVSPADKAAIAAHAAELGITGSEFVRRAVAAYDPDDGALLDELGLLSLELNRAAARLAQKLLESREEAERNRNYLRHRTELIADIRKKLLKEDLDWNALGALFGPAAAKGGNWVEVWENFDRRNEAKRPRAAVAEPKAPFVAIDYVEWRKQQMANLDRDFEEYRREHQSRFDEEFGRWRAEKAAARSDSENAHRGMPVRSCDGDIVGIVRDVTDGRIRLEEGGATQEAIPWGWVASVLDEVVLNRTAEEVAKVRSVA